MTGWLLDTNVLSELRKPRPDARVQAFVAAQPLERLFVSSVSLAEIRYGIARLDDPLRRAELTDWLDLRLRPLFTQRVLDVSDDVMLRWRLLVEEGRRAGHTFSQPNLLIAATALQHGLTVVTRDTADLERARVPLRNPWAGETA